MPVTINGSTGLTANNGSVFTNASGNVGIGTSSPTKKLEISSGDILMTQAAGILCQINIAGNGNSEVTSFQVRQDGSNNALLTNRANGAMIFSTNNTQRAIISATGDFSFNSGYGSVAVAYGCRAWVNFNGTGTVAIRASGNVSSISDNGTGDYYVNYTTSMPDGNSGVVGMTQDDVGTNASGIVVLSSQEPSRARILSSGTNGTKKDFAYIGVSVFR